MEYFRYVFIAVLIAISIISVIYCIVRGKGISHKMLIFVVSLLGVVAMICLGGNVILSMLGMGWRCKPFNTMLNLCFVVWYMGTHQFKRYESCLDRVWSYLHVTCDLHSTDIDIFLFQCVQLA